jgi:hypothetical protein
VVVIEHHAHEDYTKEKLTIFDYTTRMSEKKNDTTRMPMNAHTTSLRTTI